LAGGSACHRQQKPAMDATHVIALSSAAPSARYEVPKEPLAREFEKYFRKYDGWVDAVVDWNYSDRKQEGTLIRISSVPMPALLANSDPQIQQMLSGLENDANGLYFRGHNTIIVGKNDWRNAIDHELAHAMSVAVNDGLHIRLEGYSGPSDAEITRITEKRLQKTKNEGALPAWYAYQRMSLELSKLFFRWYDTVKTFRYYEERLMGRAQEIQDKLNAEQKTKRKGGKAKEDPELALAKELNRLGKMERNAEAIMMGYAIALANQENAAQLYTRNSKKNSGICLDEQNQHLRNSLQNIWVLVPILVSRETQLKEIDAFNRSAQAVFGPAVIQKENWVGERPDFQAEEERLEKGVNQGLLTIMETFARIVASYLGLEVRPNCVMQFRLTGEERWMLRAIKVDGKPIFQKADERYELALKMDEDGVAADVIKAKLEFAEHFEYAGKEYNWPPHHISIKGTVPAITRIPLKPWEYEGEPQNASQKPQNGYKIEPTF